MILNNLAWTAGQTKDPKALEYAEKAYKLAPDQPVVLDTLGVLLVEKGDKARGVEMLQKASKMQPAAASIRLNLAKALISHGAEGCREEGAGGAREAGRQVQVSGRGRAVDEGALTVPFDRTRRLSYPRPHRDSE